MLKLLVFFLSEVILYPYSFDVNGVPAANLSASSSAIGTTFPQGAVLTFNSIVAGLPNKVQLSLKPRFDSQHSSVSLNTGSPNLLRVPQGEDHH